MRFAQVNVTIRLAGLLAAGALVTSLVLQPPWAGAASSTAITKVVASDADSAPDTGGTFVRFDEPMTNAKDTVFVAEYTGPGAGVFLQHSGQLLFRKHSYLQIEMRSFIRLPGHAVLADENENSE